MNEYEDDPVSPENEDQKTPTSETETDVTGETTGTTAEKTVEQILAEENSRLQKETEALKDQFLRKVAEFDNYRRRTEKEFAGLILSANEKLIREMLPILDDLERSQKAAKEAGEAGSIYQGIELITNKLMKALEAQGLEAMDPVGKEFDVNQHDALLTVENDKVPSHTVIDQHEKGYLLNGKVIRHAKVIVSK